MSKYPVHPRGYWQHEGGHKFDKMLAAGVAELFDFAGVHSVIDIGCGDGCYTTYLHSADFQVVGYDGNPLTPKMCDLCKVADFSEAQDLGRYDAVLSLEVGEHIPPEYEAVFIGNLTRHAEKLIVLSWAIPGQGGHGHFNERDNGYIVMALAECGWDIDWDKTNFLRGRVTSCFWFDDTLMVFEKAQDATD